MICTFDCKRTVFDSGRRRGGGLGRKGPGVLIPELYWEVGIGAAEKRNELILIRADGTFGGVLAVDTDGVSWKTTCSLLI